MGFLGGGISGALVTPIISAVDRALAENASGKCTLWKSFFSSFKEMARAPLTFLKSPQFGWIWLVYGGTYVSVNVTETICEVSKTDPALPKWLISFGVNTTTCILKDRAFAKLFGTQSSGKVPLGSYSAWLTRDIVSMGVFLHYHPLLVNKLQVWLEMKRKVIIMPKLFFLYYCKLLQHRS